MLIDLQTRASLSVLCDFCQALMVFVCKVKKVYCFMLLIFVVISAASLEV